VTIFGAPGGNEPWGWRFGGHHLSLHYTIVSDDVVSATSNFFGADPADSPLLGPHIHRPLAAIEDLGRELFRALGVRQARISLGGNGECNQPHYYRIQGERLFVEYDNAQRGGNHIHAVWR